MRRSGHYVGAFVEVFFALNYEKLFKRKKTDELKRKKC